MSAQNHLAAYGPKSCAGRFRRSSAVETSEASGETRGRRHDPSESRRFGLSRSGWTSLIRWLGQAGPHRWGARYGSDSSARRYEPVAEIVGQPANSRLTCPSPVTAVDRPVPPPANPPESEQVMASNLSTGPVGWATTANGALLKTAVTATAARPTRIRVYLRELTRRLRR